MNDLIKIDYSKEEPTVSARELHKFLELGAYFKDWFPRMCEYGFTEGIDFSSILSQSTGKNLALIIKFQNQWRRNFV